MVRLGIVGIVIFALGGLVLSSQFYDLLMSIHVSSPDIFSHLVTFAGFLLLGLGLWLIVHDKPTRTQPT
jgi:uncharacterized membrane protein YdcZ (DUF606 family)